MVHALAMWMDSGLEGALASMEANLIVGSNRLYLYGA